MNYMKKLALAFSFCAFLSASLLGADANRETVAVFVRNGGSDKSVDACLGAFEGALCSKINEAGFSSMNRNVIITELSKYSKNSSPEAAIAEKLLKVLKGESGGSEDIYSSASMLNVAKMLGADYVLDAQISSLASDTRSYSDLNSNTLTTRTVMRATYSLYEAGIGAGTAGGSVKSDTVIRQTKNLAVENADMANELVDSIAEQIADSLTADKRKSGGFIPKIKKSYPVQIYCFIEGMRFPHIIVNQKGEYTVGEGYIPAEAGGVTVMLDGAVIGNASSASSVTDERGSLNVFNLPSGIHQMRFERADLKPFDRMVNVSDNMKMFSVYLQMTDDARERWKSDSVFFESLKLNSKLSDAEVERIEAMAQTYRNSGFKIDYKTDTDQPITIQQNSSVLPPAIR